MKLHYHPISHNCRRVLATIYELDRDEGTVLRTWDLPGLAPGALAFYGAEIFARMGDHLLVLDYGTGKVKRTVHPDFNGPAAGSSRGLVSLQDGALAVWNLFK